MGSLRKVHSGHGQLPLFLWGVDLWRFSFSCVDGKGISNGLERRFFEGFSTMSSGESVCFRLTGSWGTLLAIMEVLWKGKRQHSSLTVGEDEIERKIGTLLEKLKTN